MGFKPFDLYDTGTEFIAKILNVEKRDTMNSIEVPNSLNNEYLITGCCESIVRIGDKVCGLSSWITLRLWLF